MYAWLRYWRPKRFRSSGHTSHSGRPSTIHSPITLPTPPAPASPCAHPPAATQKPGTSDSPSRKSASGVNASGPLKNIFTSTVSIAGTRRIAFSNSSCIRSQSSGSSFASKPSGMPSSAHAAGLRS